MNTPDVSEILEKAVAHARRHQWRSVANRLEDVQSASKYSESGYSTTKPLILFGNWNNPVDYKREYRERIAFGPTKVIRHYACKSDERQAEFFDRLTQALEKLAELEWSDEWTTCNHCGGAVRISGDSYGWQRAFVEVEGDVICRECAPKHAVEILATFENESRKALTADLGIDPTAHDYVKLSQEFENGLYGGQDASPEKIAEALRARDVTRFLFRIESVGQFDMKFACYVHKDEADRVGELPEDQTKADLDPAEGLKRALQSIRTEPGPGINYTKCDVSTGTSSTRKVSADEFRKGIKD